MESVLPTSEDQLNCFIAKYTPEIAKETHAVLQKLRSRLPGALEVVYDNYNALAIGFTPTEKVSHVIFSIAIYPRWINLFFMQAAGLDDPNGLLQGNGTVAKHIRLDGPATLDAPEVISLMEHALDRAVVPLDPNQPGRIVIKYVSEKQRSRRPQ